MKFLYNVLILLTKHSPSEKKFLRNQNANLMKMYNVKFMVAKGIAYNVSRSTFQLIGEENRSCWACYHLLKSSMINLIVINQG